MRIAVVGCGVIGLTTAIRLAQHGHKVTIYAREFPPCTTSDRAAAIWWPDLAADPAKVDADYRHRVVTWAGAAWHTYRRLATDPAAGIRPEVCHIYSTQPPYNPIVAQIVEHSYIEPTPNLQPPLAWHWQFESLLIEMPRLMPYLLDHFASLGGTTLCRAFMQLHDLRALPADLVVNCTGLGSRSLVPDPDLTPIRGQLIHLRPQTIGYKLTTLSQNRSIYSDGAQ